RHDTPAAKRALDARSGLAARPPVSFRRARVLATVRAPGGHPSDGVTMRAQLVPLDGSSAVEIVKDLTLVGRKEDCDLRLDHKSVSKMHCVIVKTDGLLLLRDLGSTNGTRVNGQRIRRAALLPNDQLTIAHFKLRIQLGPH